MYWVYILKSVERSWYYAGSTNNLDRRFSEHQSGKVRSTKGYRPLELVFSKEFLTESEARSYEKRLKQDRVEKERVIKSL